MTATLDIPTMDQCGVISPEQWKSMSGLEVMKAIIAGKLPAPPIAALVGFTAIEAEEGKAVFAGIPSREHYNPAGTVHGGYAALLLDSCMTCAVQSTLEAGYGCTTLEYKINLVRPMTDQTGPVRAIGTVIHPGKRTATAEGKIVDTKDRILAHGTTTVFVFPL